MKKWICAILCLSIVAGLSSVHAEAVSEENTGGVSLYAVPAASEAETAAPTPKPTATATAVPGTVTATPEATASVETDKTETAVPKQTPQPVFTGNKIIKDENVFVTIENSADKSCTITGYTGDTGVTTLYIPAKIKKQSVAAVAEGVLANCPFLKNVVVLGDTEFQGAGAFAAASGVEIWGKTGGKANTYATANGLVFHALEGSAGISAKRGSTLKSASITWSAVNGAVSYNLYRKKEKGKYSLCKNLTATSFADGGLKPGTVYTYRTKPVFTAANGDEIEGLASKEASIAMKPSKLKKVRATSIRGGVIQVRWKRDKSVSGYQVFMKVHYHIKGFKPDFGRVKTIKKNKTTGYRSNLRVPGMKYSYKVRSYKKVNGKKIYGPFVTVTTKAK